MSFLVLAGPLVAGGKPTDQQAIGWRLFFDPLLSRPQNFSCGTCHDPEKGYEGGEALSRGAHSDLLSRSTPTVVNLADADLLFWDGRASSLAEQAAGPLTNPLEMDMTVEEAVERVRAQPHYRRAFSRIGVNKIQADDIFNAIAAFEAALTTGETSFDRWLAGDRQALSETEERGRVIFFTKGNCALCHNGVHLTDGDFHNIGSGTPEDRGRGAIVEDQYFDGAFKTPALRNWKGREPFMHDGRFATMRDVIEFYRDPPPNQVGVSEIDPIEISDTEADDLLTFLETLNGDWPDLDPFEQAWQELIAE